MANTFDCEPYLRALEEQADSIGGAATGLLQAMETFKENAASMVRTVENLKKMIGMTRRVMNLAHGGRVVERVEVKRESPSSSQTEDWDDKPACQSPRIGIRNPTSPPIQRHSSDSCLQNRREESTLGTTLSSLWGPSAKVCLFYLIVEFYSNQRPYSGPHILFRKNKFYNVTVSL